MRRPITDVHVVGRMPNARTGSSPRCGTVSPESHRTYQRHRRASRGANRRHGDELDVAVLAARDVAFSAHVNAIESFRRRSRSSTRHSSPPSATDRRPAQRGPLRGRRSWQRSPFASSPAMRSRNSAPRPRAEVERRRYHMYEMVRTLPSTFSPPLRCLRMRHKRTPARKNFSGTACRTPVERHGLSTALASRETRPVHIDDTSHLPDPTGDLPRNAKPSDLSACRQHTPASSSSKRAS